MSEVPQLPASPLADPDARAVDPRWDRWRRVALAAGYGLIGVYVLSVSGIFVFVIGMSGGMSGITSWDDVVFPLLLPGPELVLGLQALLLGLRRDGAGRVVGIAAAVVTLPLAAGHWYLLGESGHDGILLAYCLAMLAADALLLLVAAVRRRRFAWIPAGLCGLVVGGGSGVLLFEFFGSGMTGGGVDEWVFAAAMCFAPMLGGITVIGVAATMPREPWEKGRATDA